jgi:SAM-dependent methyltransferase
MPDLEPENLYDAYYFAHCCGRPYRRDQAWLQFFARIAEGIQVAIQPRSVLDAGCALGFLVEALRARQIAAFGVDISEYALQQVAPEMQAFCRRGSVTEPFPQADPFPARYDLIVCMEVLEHLPPAQADLAVANLCRSTDDILFSSSPFDYREPTHFNVQPPEYWAELFARQGFFRDVDFDAAFVTPWAVRFRRRNETPARLAREYERKYFLLAKENADLRGLSAELRAQLTDNVQLAERLRAQLAEKEKVADALAGQVHELSARLERQERELHSLAEQLNAILNSRRWRLVNWLRKPW